MPVLGNDDFCKPPDGFELGFPLDVKVRFRKRRLTPREVIVLAEHEENGIGVLFNRATISQVGKLRALIVAGFYLSGELGQRDDRNIERLRKRLQAAGNRGNFLNAVLMLAAAIAAHDLEVINDEADGLVEM